MNSATEIAALKKIAAGERVDVRTIEALVQQKLVKINMYSRPALTAAGRKILGT